MKDFCDMSELYKRLSGANDMGFNEIWTSTSKCHSIKNNREKSSP